MAFGYDAAGNRTSMTDGLGSVSYAYNQLSQMTPETRTFADANSPYLSGSFALTYGYNPAGELTSITNPWGSQVSYSYDKVGRPASISGAGPVSAATYANNFSYRAFGLKGMSYGNGRALSLNYALNALGCAGGDGLELFLQ